MRPTTTVLRPTDLVEAAAALAGSAGRVLIRGAGTAADWAGRPEPSDVTLVTTALTGVIAHNPGDMTVTVRAGTPLRELNDRLAGHGQQVALDAARVGGGATVGGLMATADSGPSALAYGSLRDLVIGVTVVLADGTPARSGGQVIKNVAGYDLVKLMHGGHGTLALIAEVVLRLHPRPAAEVTLRRACPLPEAAEAATSVLAGPLEPVALEWCRGELLARIAGTAGALGDRTRRLAVTLGPGAEQAGPEAWERHADAVGAPPGPDECVLRLGVRPSRLPRVLAALTDRLGARAVTAGLATGIATARLPAIEEAVTAAHRVVHAAGGVSTLRSRPPGTDLPGWGPAPSAIRVLRAIHAELDPGSRLGAGRFAPWM